MQIGFRWRINLLPNSELEYFFLALIKAVLLHTSLSLFDLPIGSIFFLGPQSHLCFLTVYSISIPEFSSHILPPHDPQYQFMHAVTLQFQLSKLSQAPPVKWAGIKLRSCESHTREKKWPLFFWVWAASPRLIFQVHSMSWKWLLLFQLGGLFRYVCKEVPRLHFQSLLDGRSELTPFLSYCGHKSTECGLQESILQVVSEDMPKEVDYGKSLFSLSETSWLISTAVLQFTLPPTFRRDSSFSQVL